MLTAAVRDLKLSDPDRFMLDVRTSCPELWENNPHLTPLDEADPEVSLIECNYPLIHQSNQLPYHFLHGFIDFLAGRLEFPIRPTAFRGDLHLSENEKRWFSPVEETIGTDSPFWIIVAGGKWDFTIKWWSSARYQQIVDHFRDKIQFVQVGEQGHHHPHLDGVIDLRGKTSLREIVRLMFHAEGVVCPVTFMMHLAAAVPMKDSGLYNRPCVVIAGGREPSHWEMYPHHQYLHTIGALPCCATGGCWRSRTIPLGDGDEKDRPEALCLDVAPGPLPRCMDLITPQQVIDRIEMHLFYVPNKAPDLPQIGDHNKKDQSVMEEILNEENALKRLNRYVTKVSVWPGSHQGRGIVICGGGARYFTNAWVCINLLRRHGCQLPIQLWYLGEEECDASMRSLVSPLGVECIDALEVRKQCPCRILNGWELKPYSILHCPFREVLLLDADNVPLVDPEYLFETVQFREHGATFWPDYGRLESSRPIWKLCGIEYRDEPEFESGQLLVDKQRCWNALQVTMWLNEYSDFFYRYIHGDKETFHLGFLKVSKTYAMPATPIFTLPGVMCQHDFTGRRIFQHRNLAKWTLDPAGNAGIVGFQLEDECLGYLAKLRELWSGTIESPGATEDLDPSIRPVKEKLVSRTFQYHRVGYDSRSMSFLANGRVGLGAERCEQHWRLINTGTKILLRISSDTDPTCELSLAQNGIWKGRWLLYEQMPVELVPLS